MTLRARIAWIVGLTVALLLIALGVTVQVQSARTLIGAVDDDLRAIARSIERDPRGFLVMGAPGRDRFGGAAGVVQVVGPEGRIARERWPRVAADADRVTLPVYDEVLAVARGELESALLSIEVEGVRLRMLVVPLEAGGRDGLALQVARPLDEVEEVIASLRRRTALLTTLGALIAALVAWSVAGRSIGPVSALTAAVEGVRDGSDLSRRVAVPGNEDEVARLARAFDAMLGRLEASRSAQERLAADASHELRTPLTSLRTNIEVLARDAERLAPEDRAGLAEDVAVQLDELTAMVDGLIQLTRVDAVSAHTPLDLGAVAEDVVRTARRRHPQRADDLRLAARVGHGEVSGDVRELTMAVAALLDNAVKYAPSGPITVDVVDVARPSAMVRLTVTDAGPGVDAALLPHLFERFFRAPEARSQPGAGIGLALVEGVVRAHAGDVRVANIAPHGLQVSVELPALGSH